MKGPDFRAALEDADRAWKRGGVPAPVERRLRERLVRATSAPVSSRRPAALRARWGWALGAAALLLAGAAATSLWRRSPLSSPEPLPSGIVVQQGSPELVIAKQGDAVRIVRGRAELVVARRAPGTHPARVMVSHGVIEVMGTRFTVEQGERGGRVTLHEGAIRFTPAAQNDRADVVDLVPGQSLEWPRPPARTTALSPPPREIAPPPANAGTKATTKIAAKGPSGAEAAAPSSPTTEEPIDALLERLETLRSRGLFQRAAGELGRALGRRGYPESARERLSYELGSLLTYQLRDAGRACTHWRAHAREFGRARYGREIGQAGQVLGCELH